MPTTAAAANTPPAAPPAIAATGVPSSDFFGEADAVEVLGEPIVVDPPVA